MTKTTETRKAPAAALHFAAPCELAASAEKDGVTKAPIHMVASSGQPFEHWYWGRVVVDVESMVLNKDRYTLDWCHWESEILGYGVATVREGQLAIDGELISTRNDDRSREVMLKGEAGVPFEASIKFDRSAGLVIEQYDAGTEAVVNGQTIPGPINVLRQTLLRGVAVCPYGADPYTESEFSADVNREIELTITHHSQEAIMPKDPSQTPAATDPNAEVLGTEPTPQVPAAPAEELREQVASELTARVSDYRSRFGDRGTEWAIANRPMVDCYQEFVAELKASHEKALKAKDEELAGAKSAAVELQSQIDQLSLGEETPVSSTPVNAEKTPEQKKAAELSASMPDGLAKFASGIKLPTKKG